MTLEQLGWRDSFEESRQRHAEAHLKPARVFREDKQRYTVHDGFEFRTATILGKLLFESGPDQSLLPAVGDWVMIQCFDEEAVIHAVLPRFSAFNRKGAGRTTQQQVIAANIDVVFLVSGLDNDFNIRRIERYVVQTASSGAKPVIVLNKMDLHNDVAPFVTEVERVARGVDVVCLSAVENTNTAALREYIGEGITVAFLGSSGAGKSSLVNRLIGDDYFDTQAVREDDSRGRHTTTHRELVMLPDGGLVIDTPGLRELQLWSTEEDLHAVFADIEEIAAQCRFRNCQHEGDAGCAVLAAVDAGELDEDRVASYLKLRRELAFLETRQNESAALAAKKRDKKFGKMLKDVQRNNPKR